MNIVGTGLTGLVGSRIVELLSPEFSFTNLSLETGVDITNPELVVPRIEQDKDSEWVLHLAAYTNVQQAEAEKDLGSESAAWKVNVRATESIVQACANSGKKLIYIDTDYAFDGTRMSYTEHDVPNPLGWYAKTKSEGAKRVLVMGSQGIVIRISNPYRAHPVGKTDFVHKMLERLNQGQQIVAPSDQLFVPTFIDDLASVLRAIMKQHGTGIFHAVSSVPISPFDAALLVARLYGKDESLVQSTTFASYFSGRAPTPQYAVLLDTKLSSLGVMMHSFTDGLREVHHQEMA